MDVEDNHGQVDNRRSHSRVYADLAKSSKAVAPFTYPLGVLPTGTIRRLTLAMPCSG
jgi:hypothetical protein